jgi:DNA-binding MarR family transcriptional regulator
MERTVPLKDALKRTQPFRSPAQEAGLALIRAADAFRRALAEVVGQESITLQQYNVLRILRGAGARGLPTLSVGERMIERTPGITRLLDRLEADGLVCRHRCAEDRRRVWARITSKGLEILARLDEPVARAEDRLFEGVPSADLTAAVRSMERVWSRVDRSLPGGEDA